MNSSINKNTGVIALCVFGLIGVTYLLTCDIQSLGVLSSDDAFYYYLTARNFALGNGFTFDGINQTNGFHPLWMCIVVPIFWVTGGDHDLSLRLVYALLAALFIASIFLTYRFLARITGRAPAILSMLLIVNPIVFNQFFNGLESSLLIFLLLLLLNIALKIDLVSPQMGVRNQILAGGLLALIFLSRLDTAFHLIGLSIAVLFFFRIPFWRPAAFVALVKSYGMLLLCFVVIVSPYFLWNYFQNGHLSPISGALKTSFPHIYFELTKLRKLSWMPYTLFVLLSIALIPVSVFWKQSAPRKLFFIKGEENSYMVLVYGLWLGCILQFCYTLLFTTWGAHYWHFASYIPFLLLCVAIVISHVLKATNFNRFAIIGIGIVVFVSGAFLQSITLREKEMQHSRWHAAAMWARENTAPDSVFGMTDCGYFSYFSRRATVNLDGLINGYRFQTALAEGTLEEYFADCGLDYVNDYEVKELGQSHHRVRLHRLFYSEQRKGRNGYHLLMPIDDCVYRSELYGQYLHENKGPRIRFYIWQYEPSQIIPLN